MFGIGLPELVVILAVALIVLGPQRLTEVARMLGRAYGQLRRASEEFQNTIRQDLAALERQEDANRNKAIAQEIRERWRGEGGRVHTASAAVRSYSAYAVRI